MINVTNLQIMFIYKKNFFTDRGWGERVSFFADPMSKFTFQL